MEVGIDLKGYGPIALNPSSLERQRYMGKNLLVESAKICFNRNILVCALTSEDPQIVPGSGSDRFGFYKETFLENLPLYEMNGGMLKETNGNVMFVMDEKGREVYFVNSQAVMCLDNRREESGKIQGRREGHLVFGANNVPQFRTLEATIKYCHDHGLP